jgi:hypothetical protein
MKCADNGVVKQYWIDNVAKTLHRLQEALLLFAKLET